MAPFTKHDLNLVARVRRLLREEIKREESMAVTQALGPGLKRWGRRDRLLRDERDLGELQGRIEQAGKEQAISTRAVIAQG